MDVPLAEYGRVEPIRVLINRRPGSEDLPLPSYATPDSAGLDLLAAVDAPITIEPMARALVSTGISIALPRGFEAQVRPRSGLAIKSGVTVLNSPGTIDSDYRGVIAVILVNLGSEPFTVRRGDRIAQMVIAPVTVIQWRQTPELPDSQRGSGGFGHSGR